MKAWQGSAAYAAGILLLFPAAADAESWRVNNVDNSVSIHLRQQPSNKSKVLAYIPVATTGLNGGPCVNDWCPIEFRGLNGFVFSKYLMVEEAAAKAAPETVASIAKSGGDSDVQEPPKVLALVGNLGAPIPVYAFPNEKLPVAGHLAQGTASVERVGPCIQNWCNIRSGELTGWLRDTVIAKTSGAEVTAQTGQPATGADSKETRALNNTETTATQADADAPATPLASPAEGNKLYSLAGLTSSALTMRGEADDNAPIIAFIPSDAKDIEGLHKCSGKWCLVRRGSASGWVERRHLAEEDVEATQQFQVNGWKAVEVFDQPGSEAGVVGRIPAYATGIVPIGGCDKIWCHVRYLGVAGWVSASALAPLTR